MKTKIGIMGGSFNPIHIRHMEMGMAALKEKKLDQVIFLPSGNPPHKHEELESAEHRYQMTLLSIYGLKGANVSHLELERSGIIYTADTLQILRKEYPEASFSYIVGEDSLNDLPTWHTPEVIFELCSLIVCCRSSKKLQNSETVRALEKRGARFSFLSLPPVDISSTRIREELQKGENPKTIMPHVLEYIRIFGLYGTKACPAGFGDSYQKLSTALSQKRLIHSLLVSHTARKLAQLHHVPEGKAALAALLHDCAKFLPLSDMQALVTGAGMNVDEKSFYNPNLLHGPAGSVLAREQYGILDEDILRAIRYHTTGHPGMNDLEMILFLADKIEPSRKPYEALDGLRRLSRENLSAAMKASLSSSMSYVREKKETLHPLSAQTLSWLESNTD